MIGIEVTFFFFFFGFEFSACLVILFDLVGGF